MALETLRGIKKIGGFSVVDLEELKSSHTDDKGVVDWNAVDEDRKSRPIVIDNKNNIISFRIQNGPIKEVGVNGCQVDTLISVAETIILGLNGCFPCKENEEALQHLRAAVKALDERRVDREKRKVEGLNHV